MNSMGCPSRCQRGHQGRCGSHAHQTGLAQDARQGAFDHRSIPGHEGMAAVDWGARNPEVPMLVAYSAPEDITMRKATNSVVRPGWTGAQVIFNFGQYCAQRTGIQKDHYRRAGLLLSLGPGCRFYQGVSGKRGEKVERIWHPVEAVDFSSIMAKLMSMSKEYDAVLNNSGGAQVVAFFKQWKQFGLDKIYPQILGQANVPIVSMLSELGIRPSGYTRRCTTMTAIPHRPTRNSGKLREKIRPLPGRHRPSRLRCRACCLQGHESH
jgi:hypothetical protein